MHPSVELYLKGKEKFKQKTEEVVMQNESKKCMDKKMCFTTYNSKVNN